MINEEISLQIRKSEKNGRGDFWVVDVFPYNNPDDLSLSYVHKDGTRGGYEDYPSKLEALAAARLSGLLIQDEPETSARAGDETKRYGHPDFYKMLGAMADLHSRKNHDYAGTSDPLKNLRACKRLNLTPFLGVLVRLQDKWSRLEEFIKSGQLMVKNESVIDTLMDNAVYSLLAIILYKEQQKEEKPD